MIEMRTPILYLLLETRVLLVELHSVQHIQDLNLMLYTLRRSAH